MLFRSINGILDNPDICLDPDILERGRDVVRKTNKQVAEIIGIDAAKRCCCIKPSGTSSLILGCGAGIHPHFAKRYFRRVKANKMESCLRFFRSINPHMVEDIDDLNCIITFPVNGVTYAMNDQQHLEHVLTVNKYWADHNVSCTIITNDVMGLADKIWDSQISGMTFVAPDLGTKYPHMPLEIADDCRWDYLLSNYRHIDWRNLEEKTDNTIPLAVAACDGGKCIL